MDEKQAYDDGWKAFHAGLMPSANPFHRSDFHGPWACGWHDASMGRYDPVPEPVQDRHHIQAKMLGEAYEAGWDAYLESKTLFCNPYFKSERRDLYRAWANGWMDAEYLDLYQDPDPGN